MMAPEAWRAEAWKAKEVVSVIIVTRAWCHARLRQFEGSNQWHPIAEMQCPLIKKWNLEKSFDIMSYKVLIFNFGMTLATSRSNRTAYCRVLRSRQRW